MSSSHSSNIQCDAEYLNITIHCTLDDNKLVLGGQRVPEQSSLKGDSIELLANFGCVEDNTKWFILVY